jgi:hypothetical protein
MCFLIPYFRNNQPLSCCPAVWLVASSLSLIDQGSVCWEALKKWGTSSWMNESFSFYWRKWWAKRNVRSCIGSEAKREINELGTRDRRASKEKHERWNGTGSDRMTKVYCTFSHSFVFCDYEARVRGFWRRVTYSQGVRYIIRVICQVAGDNRKFRNVCRPVPACITSHWHHQTFRGVHSKALLLGGRDDGITSIDAWSHPVPNVWHRQWLCHTLWQYTIGWYETIA